MCVCVRACVRAASFPGVRVCVRACVCVCVWVCVCVCVFVRALPSGWIGGEGWEYGSDWNIESFAVKT